MGIPRSEHQGFATPNAEMFRPLRVSVAGVSIPDLPHTKHLLVSALLLTAACSGGTGPEPNLNQTPDGAQTVSQPVQLTLRHGEERRIEGTVLRLRFNRVVEDSRCPIDAVCVWMGDGVAEVGIAAGSGTKTPLTLHTSLEPHAADWNSVRVTLLELRPAPRAAEPPDPEDYSVTLRLEPIPQ